MKKIKVAAVSYLNTKPLLYGINHHPVLNEIHLTENYPAIIAQLLVEDKIDMGLIPVAIIHKLKEWHIVGDYCIGSDGPVASVCIFSEMPMDEIKKIYLDYQSKTSVKLAQILIKEYWKKEVEWMDATGEDYRKEIIGTTAGVVIGDRALEQRLKSSYIYDLGEAWKHYTGLPFVFAAWISNKQLPLEFIGKFNEANAMGLQQISKVIIENPFSAYDLDTYYTQNISYELTDKKKEGLEVFLNAMEQF
ncbi:MAG TPA: menaquinone biosynthesis protein [Chitinophagaceae bacterium]|nr:menaquinone biosynthesis protein [Chitinophagaceae bacterium]